MEGIPTLSIDDVRRSAPPAMPPASHLALQYRRAAQTATKTKPKVETKRGRSPSSKVSARCPLADTHLRTALISASRSTVGSPQGESDRR